MQKLEAAKHSVSKTVKLCKYVYGCTKMGTLGAEALRSSWISPDLSRVGVALQKDTTAKLRFQHKSENEARITLI